MANNIQQRNEILNIYCFCCGSPAYYDIATQSYRCRYCGAETGVNQTLERKQEYRRLIRERIDSEQPSFHLFSTSCSGCGAEIVFEENEVLGSCAFCGRELVRKEYTKTEDFPEVIIPFKVTEEQAKQKLLEWCASNSHHKEAKLLKAKAEELQGFYLPYIFVKGPGTCSVKRKGTRRIYTCRNFIDEKLVNTSDNINNMVLDGMEPYDLSELQEFRFSYVAGQKLKIADIKHSEAEARVREEIAADYELLVAKTMETRDLDIDPDIGQMMSMTAVMPAYYIRAGGTAAAVNGQTGKVAVWEIKQRKLLPWWIKPFIAVIALIGLTFTASWFAIGELIGTLFLTIGLGIFFLITVFTAYHNEYAGTLRKKLRHRILTSENTEKTVLLPVFYEEIEGVKRPVKLKFTTPLRIFRMALLAVVITFLPLILGFIFNGFSASGLTVGGAAVWLCIAVPVVPIYFLKAARMHLYEKPLIYVDDGRGGYKRYLKKPDLKRIRDSLIFDSLPAVIIVTIIVLIVLIINVELVLHWNKY